LAKAGLAFCTYWASETRAPGVWTFHRLEERHPEGL
jgi:hypothetical protein